MKARTGESVEVVVTHLEMAERPGYPRPHLPTGPVSALIAAERPPTWYFLDLYDRVVDVAFVGRIRGQVAYEGVEPLIRQMNHDVVQVREVLGID